MNQNSPETNKLRQRIIVGNQVRGKSTWVAPGMETEIAMLSSSCIDANTKYKESNDGKDLDRREPKLELAIERHGEEVNGRDYKPKNADEDSDRQTIIPVLDDETSGSELESIGDGPGKPVDPAHAESEGGIDKASSVVGESTGDGDVRCHFTQGSHDAVDDCTDEDVGDESARWTRFCDRATASYEEASTDCST